MGVPAHRAPGVEHQDLELVVVVVLPFFFFLIFLFQITVGRKLIEIPRVGLRGWSEDVGKVS